MRAIVFLGVVLLAAVVFPNASAGQANPTKADPASTKAEASSSTDESDTSNSGDTTDYKTRRTEPAGFPIIGGSSDVGFQFGVVGTLSHFGDDVRPYRWNLDALLSAAIKPNAGFTQENIQANIDVPGLYGGKLRVIPQISYTKTTNLGYFGLGNASSDVVPAMVAGDPERYFESIQHEFLIRFMARIHLDLPFDLVPLVVYRHEDPIAYAGSKLAADTASPPSGGSPTALGKQALSLVSIGGGIILDTRDNEYFPHRGHLHQLGVKFVEGVPLSANVRYGQDSTVLAWFIPLRKRLTFATRALLDLQFGNVPFYDLFTGGPFKTQSMIGGSAAIRGVPVGRFLGRIKLITNQELRVMLWDFRVLKQNFHIGAGAFFDAGRLWLNYTFSAPEDGSLPGIKWGTGGTAYVIWGQAAVFRVDVAYSPSAAAFSSSLPVALYLEDSVMF